MTLLDTQTLTPRRAPATPTAHVRQRTWLRARTELMGTVAEILVDGTTGHVAVACARLRQFEQRLSRFVGYSELNRLIAQAGSWVPVSDDLMAALSWCQRMHRETAGSFDATIRSALERWGYDRTFAELRSHIDHGQLARIDAETLPRPQPTTIGAFQLNPAEGTARVEPGYSIDLGGIGKGLAADTVVAELLAADANAVYVSLGGDVRAGGEPPDTGWNVPLLHPVTGEPIAHHRLDNGALVMSTTAIRTWPTTSGQAHHLIDPTTMAPVRTSVLAVAVADRSAARAEALAKAAIIASRHDPTSGPAGGQRLLTDSGVRWWMLLDDRPQPIVG
jgi:FAD:protein FMN transferase